MKIVISTIIGIIFPFIVNARDMSTVDKLYHSSIGPSIWAFGKSGVSIYNIDGSEILKSHGNMEICGGNNCQYREAVSDGKKYIFATNAVEGTVDVFLLNTGDFVASLDTCGSPWSIDFHPIREEIWVHCWGPDVIEGDSGHVDVFSTTSIHSPLNQVKFPPTLVNHAHGTVIVDSSLGHIGYASDLNTPSLFSYDLNKRTHLDSFDMPNTSGLYRMVYSNQNKHLYLRAYVCCSCGFVGADLTKCGRGGSRLVNVTTGPNQGMLLNGTCGHGCEGSVADDIGVYEFDTVGGNIVTNWQMNDGFGADPYVSPDGKYIALFGNNGGNTVRILKPDENGVGSKLWADVNLNLYADDIASDEKPISDATFIEDDNHNIVIFTSTLSNFVVLVDLSSDKPIVSKIQLTDANEITSNHGRGARRNIVWVVGTSYVWIDSERTEEFHIIELSTDGDITKAKLKKTFAGVGVRRIIYVENYDIQADPMFQIQEISSDINSGLIVGCIALMLGLVNMLWIYRNNRIIERFKDNPTNDKDESSLPSIP